MSIFNVEPITNKIIRITMPYVSCYLVIGDKYAFLIDTGWGYGDLLKIVRSLTSLPIKVILTHGHTDHIGGISQFDEIYMHPEDSNISKANNAVATRKLIKNYLNLTNMDDSDKWQPEYAQNILPMPPEFDLGHLTILSEHVPGHTMGSMIFYIVEERIAIFGDSLSHPTLLTLPESASVERHYESLVQLKDKNYAIERAFVNHEKFEISPIVLENNLNIAYKILNEEDKKIPIKINGIEALAAREKEEWLPKDKKLIGNILYKKDNIYSKKGK